jgi:signal transduction histidine kinase
MAGTVLHRLESFFRSGPATIALVYLILGLLWIFFSDDIALRVAGGDPARFHLISTVKGFAYILVTATLLYLMIRFHEQRILEGQEAIKKNELTTRVVNRKLALMNDVAYQDIQNKVTAVRGLVDLAGSAGHEDERARLLARSKETLAAIYDLIQKTKEYQKMGVFDPRWIPVEPVVRARFSRVAAHTPVTLSCSLAGLELYSDPVIEQVFFILCDNAIIHGKTLTRIAFSCHEAPGGLVLICEDDGAGIPPDQKPLLFDRVVGGSGRFHLFFVREFLTLYGMQITETGTPGKGARFEIFVPAELFRLRA